MSSRSRRTGWEVDSRRKFGFSPGRGSGWGKRDGRLCGAHHGGGNRSMLDSAPWLASAQAELGKDLIALGEADEGARPLSEAMATAQRSPRTSARHARTPRWCGAPRKPERSAAPLASARRSSSELFREPSGGG